MTALYSGGGYQGVYAVQVKGIREAVSRAKLDVKNPTRVEVGDKKGLIARYELRKIKYQFFWIKTA